MNQKKSELNHNKNIKNKNPSIFRPWDSSKTTKQFSLFDQLKNNEKINQQKTIIKAQFGQEKAFDLKQNFDEKSAIKPDFFLNNSSKSISAKISTITNESLNSQLSFKYSSYQSQSLTSLINTYHMNLNNSSVSQPLKETLSSDYRKNNLIFPDFFNNFHFSKHCNSSFSTNSLNYPNISLYNHSSDLTSNSFLHFDNRNTMIVNNAPKPIRESEAFNFASDRQQLNQSKLMIEKQTKKQRPKRFQCPHCQVSFSNNGQLKGHIRIHTGERPFVCDHLNCGKTFTRNEELTRHKRIHTGLRPFACTVCNKRFGRKDHLKKHVKTHQRPPPLPLSLSSGYAYSAAFAAGYPWI